MDGTAYCQPHALNYIIFKENKIISKAGILKGQMKSGVDQMHYKFSLKQHKYTFLKKIK